MQVWKDKSGLERLLKLHFVGFLITKGELKMHLIKSIQVLRNGQQKT
jgi:hypothetical protein